MNGDHSRRDADEIRHMDLERLGNDEHLQRAAIEVNKAADALASMITEDGAPPQQQQRGTRGSHGGCH
jgi:hypothetical protein